MALYQAREVAYLVAIAATMVSCQEESSDRLGSPREQAADQRTASNSSDGATATPNTPSNSPTTSSQDGGSSTPSNNSPASPSNPNDKYAALRELCVKWTNDGEGAVRGRTSTSGTALVRNTAQESCVDEQGKVEMANDRAQTGFHSSLGRCGDVMQNTCGGEGYFGEADARELLHDCLIAGWLTREAATNGPHYRQIMSPQATAVTCGFYEDGRGGLEIVQAFFR